MLNQRLRECRGEKSRSQIAKALGITPQMLGALERGSKRPSLALAKKVADYYGVSIEDIFFDELGNEMF